jgi:hypothetical protein
MSDLNFSVTKLLFRISLGLGKYSSYIANGSIQDSLQILAVWQLFILPCMTLNNTERQLIAQAGP